jgi:hypothetical protein
MDGEEDILKYLNLDPDHHEKIAALIPKVKEPSVIIQIMHSKLTNKKKVIIFSSSGGFIQVSWSFALILLLIV